MDISCYIISAEYTQKHTTPKYVDNEFQGNPLNVEVDVVLPSAPLSSVFIDVSAGWSVALIQVKLYL